MLLILIEFFCINFRRGRDNSEDPIENKPEMSGRQRHQGAPGALFGPGSFGNGSIYRAAREGNTAEGRFRITSRLYI